jgi:filamentous hemagglutinin family protein
MQTCAWKRFGWRLSQLGYLTFSGIALSSGVSLAQVVPDATLGNESSVVTPSVIRDVPSDRINGGAVRGNNLFHSFREFNVGAGRGVYFTNPDGVARILTRVTGNNVSQILGTLGVLGNADLFLINPNGIIFGPGARLDLNGSFIGSTASKIRFADGLEFSATNPQSPVSSSTYTAGQAGDLTIKAADSVEIIGATRESPFLTGIGATVEFDLITQTRATGNGGNLTIQTRRLLLQSGGQIASSTQGDGNAGNLTIDASESVELIGTDPFADAEVGSSGLFVSAERGRNGNPRDATGNVGNLTLNTRRLLVQDGARISADNFGTGTGGDLTINARELSIESGGTIRANSFSEGSGGALTVNAENLRIGGSRILGDQLINSGLFVSGVGSGAAGSLTVNAATVQLDNTGRLAADSTAGSGNIRVQARDLLVLRGNSQISTNSTGQEAGGNISLTTNNLAAIGNSDITANATNSQGGRVNINATGIFGLQYQLQQTPNSDITATGGSPELSGVVEINSPEVDVNSGLVVLPTNVINVAGLVAQNACTPQQLEGSSFVVTGRGGLPPNPVNPASNEAVMVEWARVANVSQNISSQRGTNSRSNSHARVARTNEQIVEAQGWLVGADGRVVLTAGGETATPQSLGLIHPSCGGSPIQK